MIIFEAWRNLAGSLLIAVMTLITRVLELFPDSDVLVSARIITWRDDIVTALAGVNSFFPVAFLLQFITLIFSIEGIILGYKLWNWVVGFFSKKFAQHSLFE